MIDLTTIDSETIVARGQYATVRSAHENAKKKLAVLCGEFQSVAPQVLRCMQPDDDVAPDAVYVRGLLVRGRDLLEKIDACVAEIDGLAAQRAALKQSAWGRK